MQLHEKLKYLRLNKKLTQKNVAIKVGLNVRQYQRYENGEQIPTATVLSRLCHFFKVPSGYFLDDDILQEQKNT
ncbi:MAG: helix-turn-helix domain-containing protein, partial [Lachnospiraceae bacterium]|nr:helix-turn-helix domain-containing protein [Lachnospiraceae bacterium]